MNNKIKTCLWCTVDCEIYFKHISKQANEMLGEDASNLRQITAWNCEQYTTEETNVGTNETFTENTAEEGRTTNETGA